MDLFNFHSSLNETANQPQSSEAQLPTTLFAELSQTQKYAMVMMLVSLAAAPADAERTAVVQKMMFADVAMMGITQDMMLCYFQTHTKPSSQSVIATLGTITNTNVIEWLIYCGFSIIAINQNELACCLFFDWWQQLGYAPEEIERVVKKIEAFNNIMG